MDPNATLERIRQITSKHQNAEYMSDHVSDELCELVTGLDMWLSRGGFKPADWADAS